MLKNGTKMNENTIKMGKKLNGFHKAQYPYTEMSFKNCLLNI